MGKENLEEVWNEEDHMKTEDFDPKNFFVLHGMSCVRFALLVSQ